ncbi:LCP family protein [Streptomyces sp. NBC_01803]|uniref:LCP family protein n=1 Tax=Streptomyces sp. NBC_01803 TaxID=2975946 RepID=UPI002DD9BDF4|nr:LCP family protein [Streptomyces sp. NBC_01803]WSA44477.1 LCP family protein [Streptomyces sp. NBC_01803]
MRRTGIRGDDEGRSVAGVARPGQRTSPSAAPQDGPRHEPDPYEDPDVPAPRRPAADGPPSRKAPGTQGKRTRKKPKPLWRRVLVWAAGSLALLLLVVAAAGYLYVRHLNENIDKEKLNLGDNEMGESEPNAAGQTPLNILLLGSDSRDGEENQDLGGARDLAGGPVRADVQMLLHASADRSNITLISIPRDTQVTIPECTDPDTGEVYAEDQSESINMALAHGGPGCVVATWWELTGIPIDHFMMVDFAGVVDMADAVGGVPVCVEQNIHDSKSGLRLEAGETVIEGEEALQWLRTRQAFGDGSDVGRTHAQQMYLSNMVQELQSSASLSDPGELMDLAEAATNALTVDHDLGTVQKLYDLGTDLRSVPNDRINMVTLPWLPDPANPEVTIIPDPAASDELFSLVREDVPLDDQEARPAEPEKDDAGASASPEETADPEAEIPIAVRNGTGFGPEFPLPVEGRASVITDELHRLGFIAATTDITPESEGSTALLYPDIADQANAEAVADALGLPAGAVRISPSADQITLVIGADWREGTAFPETADPGGEEESGEAAGGGTGGAAEEPAVNEEDIFSGTDEERCMEVNPAHVW